MQLGAEVDLDARQDERLEAAEDADACLLEVRRVDGVVDVAHRVAVAKANTLALDPRELGHRGDGIDGTYARRDTQARSSRSPSGCGLCRPTSGFLREHRSCFTGCGTSFHAAQTGGRAVQALEAVLDPPDADIMVCVSHEGETELTMEAERAFGGDVWLVTGKADSPLAELADEVIVCTPEIERSWCHTASYTCAVAAIDALHGEEVDWLPQAVERDARPSR